MYKRGDKEFVVDMFLACKRIVEYTLDLSFDDFKRDSKTVDAVVRNIEILGEAVKSISKDFRRKYPDIDWSIIARTRDNRNTFTCRSNPESDNRWTLFSLQKPDAFGKCALLHWRWIVVQLGCV